LHGANARQLVMITPARRQQQEKNEPPQEVVDTLCVSRSLRSFRNHVFALPPRVWTAFMRGRRPDKTCICMCIAKLSTQLTLQGGAAAGGNGRLAVLSEDKKGLHRRLWLLLVLQRAGDGMGTDEHRSARMDLDNESSNSMLRHSPIPSTAGNEARQDLQSGGTGHLTDLLYVSLCSNRTA